jgi:hypothetical protein
LIEGRFTLSAFRRAAAEEVTGRRSRKLEDGPVRPAMLALGDAWPPEPGAATQAE